MSYKDFERAGPVEVRTRGPPFGSYKAEAGMSEEIRSGSSQSIGTTR